MAARLISHILVLFSLAVGSATAETILVVDPGGGGDFADLQEAIDAAPDGVVILIRGGLYSRYDDGSLRHGILVNRPLSLIADPFYSRPQLVADDEPSLQVALPAGGEVRLAGIELATTGTWCTDSVLRGWNLDRLVMDGCLVTAGSGIDKWCPTGPDAVWLNSGELVMRDSVALGGDGGSVFDPSTGNLYGGQGGAAVWAPGSRTFVLGCDLEGGNGGDGLDGWAGNGWNGDGGDALWASAALVSGGVLEAGLAGQGSAYGGRDGRTQPPWTREIPRDLSAQGTPLVGNTLRLQVINRKAFESVSFFAGLDLAFIPSLPPYAGRGATATAPLARLIFLGQARADAAGTAGLDLPLPSEPIMIGVMLALVAVDRAGITNPETVILLPPPSV